MPAQSAHVSAPPLADHALLNKTIHFVGIGGCGLSGLARLLHQSGATCSGSDSVQTDLTDSLAADGIAVAYDQTTGEVPKACEIVVASAAIKPDHPELLTAQQRGLLVYSYAEALGIVQATRTGVSLAGTHGKSTTAAMLCHALIECGIDPSFIIGAMCPQIGGGSRTGAEVMPPETPPETARDVASEKSLAGLPGVLVCEACEFNRSFHHHRPRIALINNLEEDHLDIYGTLEAIVEAFHDFARLIPPEGEGGRLLIAHEGAHRRTVTAGLDCAIETFGFSPDADYQVQFDQGTRVVSLNRGADQLAEWTCKLPGAHNALNSAAAAVLASYLGGAWNDIAAALSGFEGLDRRTQRLGARAVHGGEVIVYDDYGHHPTEIENTLHALRAAEQPKRVICVFQPHQHSRTRFLLDEFAQSFTSADVVIVPHIYFVRDSEIEKARVSARDLVDRLRARGMSAMHLYPFEAITEQLEIICAPGDLLIIMGAGPVWKIGRQFLQASGIPGREPTA